MNQVKCFKGFLPQILFAPFLNTLSHLRYFFVLVINFINPLLEKFPHFFQLNDGFRFSFRNKNGRIFLDQLNIVIASFQTQHLVNCTGNVRLVHLQNQQKSKIYLNLVLSKLVASSPPFLSFCYSEKKRLRRSLFRFVGDEVKFMG